MAGIQFNGHSDNQDVVSEIKALCNADTNAYPLKDIARRANMALDRFFTLAFEADGRWVYDDPSNDSLPIQTINLVSGTQDYNLDDFTSEILDILRIEAANSSSVDQFVVLHRLDRANLHNIALSEYYKTNGIPYKYDLVGEYIRLYPAPNYAATNGLRIYLARNKVAFASTDTTKTLPIPSLFSQYICHQAALPWLIENQRPQAAQIAALIARDEVAIRDYFSHREKGEAGRKKLTMRAGRFR